MVVSINMLLAALLLLPWILRRETASGLIGRWFETECGWKSRAAGMLMPVVDWLVFWERRHCIKTYREERDARRILYGADE